MDGMEKDTRNVLDFMVEHCCLGESTEADIKWVWGDGVLHVIVIENLGVHIISCEADGEPKEIYIDSTTWARIKEFINGR